MKMPDTSIIDKPWPAEELEHIERCLYCDSNERTLAYKDVRDWSFYCAPGKWVYWECKECESLYLSPRPTEASIGKAYGSYYTHNSNALSYLQQLKVKVRNEYFSHKFEVNLSPRLHLPKSFGNVLKVLKFFITQPFELELLATLPKGKLLDVGCGSGHMLKLAQQLGWEVTGIEIDPKAVAVARAQGLNVVQGDYRKLESFLNGFDCIVCSHVLEHIHNPIELLKLLENAINKNGVLLLSAPNAKSHMRKYFGENWRGLEAPRHVTIPSMAIITKKFSNGNVISDENYFSTYSESKRIEKRAIRLSFFDNMKILFTKKVAAIKYAKAPVSSDFLLIKYFK